MSFVPRSFIVRVFIPLIFFLIFVEFLMFSYLSRNKVTDFDTKFIKDYETILCRLERSAEVIENPTAACPNEGIVTAFKHWSLPQDMWVYANVIALSMSTRLRPYVPICLKESLSRMFRNLSIPVLSTIGHCVLPLPDSADSLEEWEGTTQSIVISHAETYNEEVMKYINIACHEFVFNPDFVNLAYEHLTRVRREQGGRKNITFVAVHITKTTIILNQEYDDIYPNVQFFLSAMNYFRNKYENVVFVVIADREGVWRSIFKAKDVHVTGEASLDSPEAILPILSYCNHTILSSAGNAVWGAILSKGETVVSLSLSEDYNSVVKHYEEWFYMTSEPQQENKELPIFH